MPRGLFNWDFSSVTTVLKENNFRLHHIKGSHYFYIGHYGGRMRQVCVPKHGSLTFKPRTFKGMMLQSGMPKEKWGI